MCLMIDAEKTKQFERKKNKRDYRVFYKIFDFDKQFNLYSPYQSFKVSFAYTDWIITNDILKVDPKISVSKGVFHGYSQKPEPTLALFGAMAICIPIVVLNDDVVALSASLEICFLKYRITAQTWKRMVKGDFGIS